MKACPICGGPVPEGPIGRPARFCSGACTKRAQRRRRRLGEQASALEAAAAEWDGLRGAPVSRDPGYPARMAEACRAQAAELRELARSDRADDHEGGEHMHEEGDVERLWLMIAGAAHSGWSEAKRGRMLRRLQRGEPVTVAFETDAEGAELMCTYVGPELAFSQPTRDVGANP